MPTVARKRLSDRLYAWLFPSIYLYRNPFKVFEFNQVVGHISFTGREVVLDIGCGLGKQTFAIAAKAGRAIGLDPDPECIAGAQRVLQNHPSSRAEFRCAMIQSAGLSDESVDCVVSFSVLEHIADCDAVIAECRRILKPGGQLLLSVDNLDGMTGHPLFEKHTVDHKISQRFQAGEFQARLARLGFRSANVYPILRSSYARAAFLKGIESQFRYSVAETLWVFLRIAIAEKRSRGDAHGLFLVACCVK